MKHRKPRLLAALLAAAMMFQLLPLVAFADDPDTVAAGKARVIGDTQYDTLEDAVRNAADGATITLGKGEYTLYDTELTAHKELTFVGQGAEKTIWEIGTDTEKDCSLNGSKRITFKNMTLEAGNNDYLGFAHSNDTVVENCTLKGVTAYWGYNTATFNDCVFEAPGSENSGYGRVNYAVWAYCSATMTFNRCTFHTAGKTIKVYNESSEKDITVNFNQCTVTSTQQKKAALNVNAEHRGDKKFILNITDSTVDDNTKCDGRTCSRLYGFGDSPCGKTVVSINGTKVWEYGNMVSHAYSDGDAENAYDTHTSPWKSAADNPARQTCTVIKECQFCHYREKSTLTCDLNRDVAAGEQVDCNTYFYLEGTLEGGHVMVTAEPGRAGYRFEGWSDGEGHVYHKADTFELRSGENLTLTAQWADPAADPILTVEGGTITAKKDGAELTLDIQQDGDTQKAAVPAGAEVTVTLNRQGVPQGMDFDLWKFNDDALMGDLELYQDTVHFTMPNHALGVKAMYKDASVAGSDPCILGTAALIGTAAVSGAVLAYQLYQLGTEAWLYAQLPSGAVIPENRIQLAKLLWNDAGKPAIAAADRYTDLDADDSEARQAAQWAVDQGLVDELDENKPDQYGPAVPVTRMQVIHAWNQAQDLKKSQKTA